MDANSRKPNAHGVAVEPDRVKTSVAVTLGIVLAGSAIVSAILVLWVFRGLDRRAEKKDEATIAAAGLERRVEAVPPAPRLQVQPVRHWRDFRDAEMARLSTYGWMDRASGAVHIPIERAMELVAERGVAPLGAAPVMAAAPGAKK